MFKIRKATLDDLSTIRSLADIVFPHTYREILSSEQLDYMMDWMYSDESLRRQMIAEGHLYYIAYKEGEPVGYVSIQPEGEHTSRERHYNKRAFPSQAFQLIVILRAEIVAENGRNSNTVPNENGNKHEVYIHHNTVGADSVLACVSHELNIVKNSDKRH